MKPIIFCIVGESGSGKTLLAESLEKFYGIKMIESHTDRPPRYPGEKGHTFHTPEEFDQFKQEDMIAFTKFGDYRYCCLRSDVLPINTYVIDEVGLQYLKKHFQDIYEIVAIRVYRGDTERIKAVGEDRVRRDDGRFTMEDWQFDVVLVNKDAFEFLFNASQRVRRVIEKLAFDIVRSVKFTR